MNATKRKFNTLIQGIGARSPHIPDIDDRDTGTSIQDEAIPSSPLSRIPASIATPDATAKTTGASTTQNSPSPSSIDLLNKRRRIGIVDMSPPSNGKTGSTTTISPVVLKKWTGTTTTSSSTITSSRSQKETRNEPPRYCPSDRDQLIRRLATFQELTEWTPKPDKVNEIEWAKRGWVCQGGERVRCTLCNKELVVKINTKTVDGKQVPVVVGSDVEQGLTKRYSELIIDAHEEDCLWRRHGCDDSLLRLPLTAPQTALASLRERYDDLCTRPSFLPYPFNLRLPPTLDLKAVQTQLPPTFFNKPPPPPTNPSTPSEVALALALTGWQGLTNPRIGAVPNSATCATCLRRLGLWMFRSKEVDEATGEILVSAPMDHLDPVREHRFFCPWRNAAVQQNPGSKSRTSTKTKDDNNKAMPGWEILAQTLKNSAYLRQQAEKSTHRNPFHRAAASLPGTPSRGSSKNWRDNFPGTPTREGESIIATPEKAGADSVGVGTGLGGHEEEEEEDLAARDVKDKERWAKLRRVKSLFDTKGRKRAQRALTLSRPGTASSRPPTAQSKGESVGGGGKA